MTTKYAQGTSVPVTEKYYPVKDRSSKSPKSGIKGLWGKTL
jgi:hypothetical protein